MTGLVIPQLPLIAGPVTYLPLVQASDEQIAFAVDAVRDTLSDPFGTMKTWTSRLREPSIGLSPYLWSGLLLAGGKPSGWAGWLPYPGVDNAWGTSTYLAPALRGSGAFDTAMCLQAHLAADLRARWPETVRLVTSVPPLNTRALTAHQRYAAAHGWGDWVMAREPNRLAWVIDWPADPVPHTCRILPA